MTQTRRDFLRTSIIGAAGLGIISSIPAKLIAAEATDRIPVRKIKPIAGKKAKRVLMISLDGIRTDGFEQANTPNLDRLMADGALSMNTRVVMPSVTQANWMSHLSSSGPEIHGVDSNDWLLAKHSLDPVVADSDGYFPTIFKVLKDEVPGVKTAFYYNWAPLINPYNTRYLDVARFEENDQYLDNYAHALQFMKDNRDNPTVVFLYSVHTDHAGHKHKWMSPEYIASIEEADVNIGHLLDSMKEAGIYDDTHFMFITDHGGIGYGHGGMSPQEMIVPWGITGPGIARGLKITEPNNTVNTASTILALFGLQQPDCWTGEIPASIIAKR